ncbi:peptidoglycan bridge formation glycyltransferase FemA/FemB family protein [Treponema zuelzerae]|uniref:Peptidoglycan bridge formation glycyltransferase FemA/FemB family protein n=1 Tax=Teretinema zuelzerae TaxID=156 RepID=A0AAE3EJH2_9SPIR|nr:peptidoglycan bridge formation glycyltransferase FemA/FemB family protein [Teretinema zuelzerae]MCD1654619.1 peptidoglycan bridge formation glycyltransferase FemA/FemB family protein [Teretinema zuelzerae]
MKLTPLSLPFTSNAGSVSSPPRSFLQTPFWCEFKKDHGWRPFYFLIEDNPPRLLSVLVRCIKRYGDIAYVPLGPDIDCIDSKEQGRILDSLAAELKRLLPKSVRYIRFDPPWFVQEQLSTDGESPELAAGPAFIRQRPDGSGCAAPVDIQPPDTVVLNLPPLSVPDGEARLLDVMKPKWRYNIKLGQKKGLKVDCYEGDSAIQTGLQIFWTLYLETAERDGIALHDKRYYQDLFTHAAAFENTGYDKKRSVRVYIASHEGSPLAAIVTLFCGDEAVYLYGASSNEKRNLMPAYALQWQAIRDARDFGCAWYDFYGIPPTDDENHPMHGLYRFKTGFGGTIIHRCGSIDYPCNALYYYAGRSAELLRAVWFKKMKKMFRKNTRRK